MNDDFWKLQRLHIPLVVQVKKSNNEWSLASGGIKLSLLYKII